MRNRIIVILGILVLIGCGSKPRLAVPISQASKPYTYRLYVPHRYMAHDPVSALQDKKYYVPTILSTHRKGKIPAEHIVLGSRKGQVGAWVEIGDKSIKMINFRVYDPEVKGYIYKNAALNGSYRIIRPSEAPVLPKRKVVSTKRMPAPKEVRRRMNRKYFHRKDQVPKVIPPRYPN